MTVTRYNILVSLLVYVYHIMSLSVHCAKLFYAANGPLARIEYRGCVFALWPYTGPFYIANPICLYRKYVLYRKTYMLPVWLQLLNPIVDVLHFILAMNMNMQIGHEYRRSASAHWPFRELRVFVCSFDLQHMNTRRSLNGQ